MKLIKKIAAIMLSVMMVLGMASVVSADEGETAAPTGNGKITINNAIAGQTYKIYKILELESYDATTGNYAYKATSDWKTFIDSSVAYFKTDSNGGVTWNATSGETKDQKATRAAEFAKLALARANKSDEIINPIRTETANSSETTPQKIEFSNLSLGYYLVDSSAGALCSLDTIVSNIEIQEKNGVPSVEKKVQEDSKVGKADEWGESNTVDIGQTVNFQTTITAQPGAQNYVLHDKMDAGLTFTDGSVAVKLKSSQTEKNLTGGTEYTLTTSGLTDGCTFEIAFTQEFCDTLTANDQIIVTYSATLADDAVSKTEYENETWLNYGDSKETTHDTTTTKTYSIPVFKYTKDGQTDKALAGATFTLSKNQDGTNRIELVSVSNNDTNGDIYRVAKTTEETGTTKITAVTTRDSGKFTIKGLDADTYYLTETKQPAGYNKLKNPIKVVISEEGTITVDNGTTSVDKVEVQNNTGTILPSTGGNGTSLIYFLGAVLALGSSVVLITKKRMR